MWWGWGEELHSDRLLWKTILASLSLHIIFHFIQSFCDCLKDNLMLIFTIKGCEGVRRVIKYIIIINWGKVSFHMKSLMVWGMKPTSICSRLHCLPCFRLPRWRFQHSSWLLWRLLCWKNVTWYIRLCMHHLPFLSLLYFQLVLKDSWAFLFGDFLESEHFLLGFAEFNQG